MSGAGAWVLGARPRTLPAGVAPVLVGTAVAHHDGTVIWWRAVAALVVALAVQVGTNYANDYSDGIRGTDADRVGPVRLVAAGIRAPAAVRRAAWIAFAVAGVAGLILAAATSWWLVPVGAAAIAAGWLYTGGPRPYGYAGLGEVFVFVFFGLVATVGSAYVHLGEVTGRGWRAGVAVGLLATALLVVNNLRDIPTDALAGKATLAVRLGDGPTRALYAALVVSAMGVGVTVSGGGWLSLLALPLAVGPVRTVLGGAVGHQLVPVLAATGRLQLVYAGLLAVGLAVT